MNNFKSALVRLSLLQTQDISDTSWIAYRDQNFFNLTISFTQFTLIFTERCHTTQKTTPSNVSENYWHFWQRICCRPLQVGTYKTQEANEAMTYLAQCTICTLLVGPTNTVHFLVHSCCVLQEWGGSKVKFNYSNLNLKVHKDIILKSKDMAGQNTWF